jgi:hypothetical protein
MPSRIRKPKYVDGHIPSAEIIGDDSGKFSFEEEKLLELSTSDLRNMLTIISPDHKLLNGKRRSSRTLASAIVKELDKMDDHPGILQSFYDKLYSGDEPEIIQGEKEDAGEPELTKVTDAPEPKSPKEKTATVDKQVGSIVYGLRYTQNLGNYENVQINVSVTLPIDASVDVVESAKDTIDTARELVMSEMVKDLSEVGKIAS